MTRLVHLVAAALLGAAMQQAAAERQPAATGVIAGQVIDAVSARPVGGAIVTLAAGAPPAVSASGTTPLVSAQARRGVAVANADGRFVFREVPAGSYWLTSTFEGYAPGASGRRRPGGPARSLTMGEGARLTDLAIPVWRLAAISGAVRDDRGDPAVGVSVWAMRRVVTGGRAEYTFTGGTVEATDDRGYYRLSNLAPGSYVVAVRTFTQSAAVSTVEAYQSAVTSGTTAALTRMWGETGALRFGRDGLTVDDWQVWISVGVPQPLSGPSGTVLIHPTVFHSNTTSAADATVIALKPGDDRMSVDLTLPLVTGVRVSGVLIGPDGPAANHGIRLIPAATETSFDTPAAYSTTDGAGRFALLGVPPGAYTIRAYRVPQPTLIMRPAPPAAGGLPGTTTEPIPSLAGPTGPSLFAEAPVAVGSTHVDGLTLTLRPGARLSGRVMFEGAAPAPPAARLQQMALTIRPIIGSVAGRADARIDAEGRFTTSGYPPGRYTIDIAPPGPEWTLASVRIGDVDAAGQAFPLGSTDVGDVVVAFTDRPITLSGTVRARDAGADTEATVIVFPADLQSWLTSGMSPRRVVAAATTTTGSYQMRIPLPGDYLVVAVPPDVAPEVDPDFLRRITPDGVRVSLSLGDARTQALAVSRVR